MMQFSTMTPPVMTEAEAVSLVQSGQRVYIGGGCGVPTLLLHALIAQAPVLRDVEIIHMLTAGEDSTTAPQYQAAFRHNALFVGANVRAAVHEGRADFTPIFLSEIPRLFRSGQLPIDVAMIQVSPPDLHGFCSLGVEVGCTLPAARTLSVRRRRRCWQGRPTALSWQPTARSPTRPPGSR